MVDLAKPAFKLGVAALQGRPRRARAAGERHAPTSRQYRCARRRSRRVKVTPGRQAAGRRGGRLRRGRRGPARAARQRLVEAARRDDAASAPGAWRPAPRRARSSAGATTAARRSPPAAAAAAARRASCSTRCCCGSRGVVARRQRRGDDRGAAERLADQLPARRGRRRRAVQQFGTGSTSIRVTQDLQMLAGLPPLVREGDRFSAMLTLRNTTAQAR